MTGAATTLALMFAARRAPAVIRDDSIPANLTQNLVAMWMMNEGGGSPIELVTDQARSDVTGTPTWATNASGTTRQYGDPVDEGFLVNPFPITGDLTIVGIFTVTTAPGSRSVIYCDYSTATFLGCALAMETTRKFSVYTDGIGGFQTNTTAATLNVPVVVGVTGHGSGAGALQWYINGVDDGTATYVPPSSYSGLRTLGRARDGSPGWIGNIGALWVYSRQLSRAEHRQIYLEILRQKFVPKLVRRYSGPQATPPLVTTTPTRTLMGVGP